MTVKFVDVEKRRRKQKELRKELLGLIGYDSCWQKRNSEKTERIREIGQMLGADSMEESRPLDAIDRETFTLAEYKALIMLEYKDRSIYKALGFKSASKWLSWRKERGFYIPYRERQKKLVEENKEDATHGDNQRIDK